MRTNYPGNKWEQDDMSEIMMEFESQGVFVVTKDNGTYRTYSDPTWVKASTPLPTINHAIKQQVAIAKNKPATKKNTGTGVTYITRKKAIDLMMNNRGHFFTAVFAKRDGSLRTMNCQYLAGQVPSPLGYLKVNEAKLVKAKNPNPIRSVNIQTLKELKIAGTYYKIK